MSGQLVLGAVGAVVGGIVGGPTGAYYGWSIGAAIGTLAFPPKQPDVVGPRLSDLRTQSNQYGSAIGMSWGRVRKGGNLIWSAPLREVETTEEEGKGGPTQKQTTYSYYGSFAIMLTEIGEAPIVGIRRIWDAMTGELIYDNDSGASILSFAASNDVANSLTVYTGSDSQLPDPTMESYLGTGNVPAYRGRSYVVFNNLPLEKFSNRIPQLSFEIIREGTIVENRQLDYLDFAFSQDITTSFVAPVGVVVEDGVISFGLYHRLEPWSTKLAFDYNLNKVSQTSLSIREKYHGFLGYLGIYPVWLDDYTISMNRRLMWGDAPLFTNIFPTYSGVTDALRGASYKDNHLYVLITDNYALGTIRMRAYTTHADGNLRILGENDVTNFFGTDLALVGNDLAMSPYGSIGNFAVEDDQAHVWLVSAGSKVKLGRIEEDFSITVLDNNIPMTIPHGWNVLQAGAHKGIFAVVSSDTGASGYADNNAVDIYTRMPAMTSDRITLSNVVTELCTFKNADSEDALTAADIDVTELTDEMDGYAIAQQTSIRSATDQLAQAYFFDAVESDDKIKFVKRGQLSIIDIEEDDLGASDKIEDKALLNVTRQQEVEVPASVCLVYSDADNAYQVATQQSRRINTIAGGPLTVELPVVIGADKAKQITDVLRIDAALARDKYNWSTTNKYCMYEPTDVVTIQGKDIRITSKTEKPNGVIEWEGYADDARNYNKSYPGASWNPTPAEVQAPAGPSHLIPLDINLLFDTEDKDFGFYAAVQGYLDGWAGAAVEKSADDGQIYTRVANATTSATVGYATTVLGSFSTYAIFDEKNTVSVKFAPGVTLSSVSESSLLANTFINNVLIGSEIVRFKNAVLSGEVYVLSGLLRGQRGTDSFIDTHVANEQAILLTTDSIRRVALSQAEIGAERLYKTTSFGTSTSEFTDFTNTAIGQKPYAPVLIGGGKSATNDIIINWTRRTRIGGDWLNSVDASLGEETESYEIEIYSSSAFTTLKRTLTASTNTVTYTSAQQVIDFGSNQTTLYVKVYQMSETYGRGYPRQATIII
jgi:hypothetical protein